jgi:F0F1-type ATP synthase assembly protein I
VSPQTPPDREHGRSGLALAGTIGGYVIACLVVGLVAGLLLDRALHSAPLFLICGVVVGFAAGFFLTYKLAMREMGD